LEQDAASVQDRGTTPRETANDERPDEQFNMPAIGAAWKRDPDLTASNPRMDSFRVFAAGFF